MYQKPWVFQVFWAVHHSWQKPCKYHGFWHIFWKILKTPRFWKVFRMKRRCLDAASIGKKLFLPGVFQGFGWTCIKNHWFFKVFELCIILGENLANTKGFGTFLWKILKTPRFWKVFGMTHRCLDEASIENNYFYLGFLKVLDENVSKPIGFSRFFKFFELFGTTGF